MRRPLHPTVGPWLYFVKASKDGHSAFATTLAEHQANVTRAKAGQRIRVDGAWTARQGWER